MADSSSRDDILRRRKFRRRIRYFIVAGSVFFTFFGAYILLYSTRFRIQTVEAQVRDDLNKSIAQAAWKYINASSPIFVPKTNALFLDKKSLDITLINSFPEMRNFQFVYNVPARTLIVRATPRDTVALWCVSGRTTCYAIDEGSIPFREVTATSANKYLRITDESGAAPVLGTATLPLPFFESLIRYWNAGQNLRILTEAVIEKESVGAGYIRFETSQRWYILVRTSISPEETYAKIQTVLKMPNLPQLRYIDARYPDKIYYK